MAETNAQHISVIEKDYIDVIKKCDLWIAIKKYANADNSLIAETLCKFGALTSGELRDKTGLSTSRLNHSLVDMRNAEIIKKVGKTYCITIYGALILESIKEIKEKLRNVPEASLLGAVQPYEQEKKAILA